MAKKIKVALYKVGQPMQVVEIDSGLKPMQDLVGGYIECAQGPLGTDLWCNEEGLLLDLPVQFRKGMGQPIAGDFFLARSNDDGDTVSLTDADISTLQTM